MRGGDGSLKREPGMARAAIHRSRLAAVGALLLVCSAGAQDCDIPLAAGSWASSPGWTLWNDRYRTVRGPVLRVEHTSGATYRESWNDTELTPDVDGGWATVELSIDPRGVGVVCRRRGEASEAANE